MAKIYYVLPGVDYGRPLDGVIPGAPNFTYGDFVSSDKAVRLGIANVPNEDQWKAVETLAKDIIQPLRNIVGPISINSGYRCKALNDALGSSDTSFHRTGGGADLHPLDCSLMTLLNEVVKANYSECIAEFFPNGWVHVGYLAGNNNKHLKLKDSNHNYSLITLDDLHKLYGNK